MNYLSQCHVTLKKKNQQTIQQSNPKEEKLNKTQTFFFEWVPARKYEFRNISRFVKQFLCPNFCSIRIDCFIIANPG